MVERPKAVTSLKPPSHSEFNARLSIGGSTNQPERTVQKNTFFETETVATNVLENLTTMSGVPSTVLSRKLKRVEKSFDDQQRMRERLVEEMSNLKV